MNVGELLQIPDDGKFEEALLTWDFNQDKRISTPLFARLLKCESEKFEADYKRWRIRVQQLPRRHIADQFALAEFPNLNQLSDPLKKRVLLNLFRRFRDAERRQQKRKSQVKTGISRQCCKKLIWVGYPDKPKTWKIEASETLSLTFYDDNVRMFGLDWLDVAWLRDLTKSLGDAFVRRRLGCWSLHQMIVLLLCLRYRFKYPVEAIAWKTFIQQLRTEGFASTLSQEGPTLVILCFTTQKPDDLDYAYAELESLRKTNSIVIVPERDELQHERLKPLEISALDTVAEDSPPEFSFRPKTCYGYKPCILESEAETVSKRSHSGSGDKVTRVQNCSFEAPTAVSTLNSGFYTIHQQLIPSLDIHGEFRVFHAAKEIIVRGSTKWDRAKDILAAKVADQSDFEHDDSRGIDKSQLDQFTMYVLQRLLAHNPKAYYSLQIGGRLDIGYHSGRLFVVEVGRWWDSHFFSASVLADPKTKYINKLATAVHEHYFRAI